MANRTKIEKLEDLIRDSIGGELVEQTVESLLPPGENYGSVMYKVDFKVKKDGKEEEYHAVAKCTPPNTVTQELFNIQETFKAEIAWYTTVIPTLKQFQKDHGVEKEIDFFQPFYGARISLDPNSDRVDLDGVMLTQNLKYLGYHNVDRHVGFDRPTTKAILRDMATFHATAIAIKHKNPEVFAAKIKPHLPKFGEIDETMQAEFNRGVFATFDELPEFNSIMDKIKYNIEKAIVFSERPLREPWVTVIHMDLWMNNIMVTGGENSKTMLLDLQIPCLGSPAADLVFFLFTSVKLEVIKEKYDDFVEYYFEQFINNLKELQYPTDDYTIDGLLKEIAEEVKVGEYAHILGHVAGILGEKGVSNFDSSDENFTKEQMASTKITVHKRQIEKFKWITDEAIKRNWI